MDIFKNYTMIPDLCFKCKETFSTTPSENRSSLLIEKFGKCTHMCIIGDDKQDLCPRKKGLL